MVNTCCWVKPDRREPRDHWPLSQEFLHRLGQEPGTPTPTRDHLARLEWKGSNEHWKCPHDEDARITKRTVGGT